MKDSRSNIIALVKRNSPVLGNILAVMLALYFLLLAAVYLYDIQEFMETVFFPHTPTIIISLVLSFIVAYAIKLGFETVARLASMLVLPIIIIVIVVGIVPNLFNMKLVPDFFPVNSWSSIVKGVIIYFPKIGEILVITMLLPVLCKNVDIKKFLFVPVIFIGLLSAAITFTLYGHFSMDSRAITYKLFDLFRVTTNFDALFMVLWVTTFFVKISALMYALLLVLGELLHLKDEKYLAYPMGIVITALSLLLFDSYVEFLIFYTTSLVLIMLLVELSVPLVLFVSNLFVQDKVKRKIVR